MTPTEFRNRYMDYNPRRVGAWASLYALLKGKDWQGPPDPFLIYHLGGQAVEAAK